MTNGFRRKKWEAMIWEKTIPSMFHKLQIYWVSWWRPRRTVHTFSSAEYSVHWCLPPKQTSLPRQFWWRVLIFRIRWGRRWRPLVLMDLLINPVCFKNMLIDFIHRCLRDLPTKHKSSGSNIWRTDHIWRLWPIENLKIFSHVLANTWKRIYL